MEKLSGILVQTYVYRLVNNKVPGSSWQITADLCELKLIQLNEDFVDLSRSRCLGGAQVFDDKAAV